MAEPSASAARSDLPSFRETALASGLNEEPQLAAAEQGVGIFMSQCTAYPEAWVQAVTENLVSQGLLTPFQAHEMLAGRRRFRLGQYTVLDEIGKGGLGQVFPADPAWMGRAVGGKGLPRAEFAPPAEGTMPPGGAEGGRVPRCSGSTNRSVPIRSCRVSARRSITRPASCTPRVENADRARNTSTLSRSRSKDICLARSEE